jgi:hypothetical protein
MDESVLETIAAMNSRYWRTFYAHQLVDATFITSWRHATYIPPHSELTLSTWLSVGLRLITDLMEASPDLYLEMVKEGPNERVAGNTDGDADSGADP